MADLNNYKEFNGKLILRDYLALDRTKLANERTLLAFIRTFIAVFGAGAGITQVYENQAAKIFGTLVIISSPVFLVLGVISYLREKSKLKQLETSYSQDTEK